MTGSAVAQDLQDQALAKAAADLKRGNYKDAPAIARNAAVVLGINSQHNLTYTGRPTQVVEHRNGDEILTKLQDTSDRTGPGRTDDRRRAC